MQRKSLWVVGVVALVLASLSGGYLYAAQGGASGQDKKQLGLFNGNDEFMGTVIDAGVNGYPTYTIFISSIDGILALGQQYTAGDIFSVFIVSDILFDAQNCVGEKFFSGNPDVSIQPQTLWYRSYDQSYYRVSIEIPESREIRSYLTEQNTCVNVTENRLTLPVTQVTLPFDLVSPLYIKPL